jgi:hypothetical protein
MDEQMEFDPPNKDILASRSGELQIDEYMWRKQCCSSSSASIVVNSVTCIPGLNTTVPAEYKSTSTD